MKIRHVALTALVLLSLTACAGTPETAPSEPTVSGQSDMQAAWEERVAGFFERADAPQPEDALAIGQHICDQTRAGIDPEQIQAIDGETNQSIVNYTLMINFPVIEAAKEAGKPLPDYCGELFPAS